MFTSCSILIGEEEFTADNVFESIVIDLIGFFFMKSIKKRLITGEHPNFIILPLILLVEWAFLIYFLIYKPYDFFILLVLVFLPKLKEVFQGLVYRFKHIKGGHTSEQKKEFKDANVPEEIPAVNTVKKQTQQRTSTATKRKSAKPKKSATEAKPNIPKNTANSVIEVKQTEEKRKIQKETYKAEIAQKKAALEQLETDIAEKKTQSDSLGSDAMAIMQKAKIDNEIKALKLQIDAAKNVIMQLKNKNLSEE